MIKLPMIPVRKCAIRSEIACLGGAQKKELGYPFIFIPYPAARACPSALALNLVHNLPLIICLRLQIALRAVQATCKILIKWSWNP